MPTMKAKQESLLMGKKGLSGASQSKSISVFSPFISLARDKLSSQACLEVWLSRDDCAQGGMCLSWRCPHPWQQGLSGLLCVSHRYRVRIDKVFKSRGGRQFGSECYLAPAPSGILSSSSQQSPDENWVPVHLFFMQTLAASQGVAAPYRVGILTVPFPPPFLRESGFWDYFFLNHGKKWLF